MQMGHWWRLILGYFRGHIKENEADAHFVVSLIIVRACVCACVCVKYHCDVCYLSTPAEEEISNMRSELEKYGIQMPTFSKIGGILANELSVDEAERE